MGHDLVAECHQGLGQNLAILNQIMELNMSDLNEWGAWLQARATRRPMGSGMQKVQDAIKALVRGIVDNSSYRDEESRQ